MNDTLIPRSAARVRGGVLKSPEHAVLRAGAAGVPPLRDGDRMDADEFLRRWEAMPEPRPRAELLEGVVWFMAPVSDGHHGAPHGQFTAWLGNYFWATPGVELGSQSSLRFGVRSMPEPDDLLRIRSECGGTCRLREDGYLEGPPEFVAEVAGSTVAKDTGLKRDLYLRHGVAEYVVWRTREGVLDWWVREGTDYVALQPDADGVLRSRVLPGLWLDAEALLREDRVRLAEVARAGTASPEHAAFVARLAEAEARNRPAV